MTIQKFYAILSKVPAIMGIKPEKIFVQNTKNQKLVSYLYRNTSKTVVILCPGLESIIGMPGVEKVYNAYYQTGCSVFVFDFSGYGESEGNKSISVKQRVADIGSIVGYLAKQYAEIMLYGVSLAGMTVAIAAAKYKEITKLIVINGLFSLNPRKLHFYQLLYLLSHPKLWPEVLYWKEHLKPKKISIPVLIVYGEKDPIIKPQQSLDFYESLQTTKTLLPIPNGDHLLMKEEYESITIAVPNWIKRQVM